ncbi:MAG: NifB/NifX family molybdenum-iron cluster-binding protein [Megasphaera sp.]|jgi:predicted Fe-Mo cluster-binding NifX family protein|nr:NifB/NifX family molybdenum-iron cluster-binding protein [Megasphaera sp.]MCI1247398.1 NifB/NifX family molybdenum-iron cluster-binding protein [Megasphaera sp.]
MIIAIPVDDTKKAVCVSFGRAPYFMFCHTEDGTTETVKNPAAEAQGGAGPKSAQLVVDRGAAALITVRCGENAATVLQMADIAIYQADGTDVRENLRSLTEGKLKKLTHFHAGFHGQP